MYKFQKCCCNKKKMLIKEKIKVFSGNNQCWALFTNMHILNDMTCQQFIKVHLCPYVAQFVMGNSNKKYCFPFLHFGLDILDRHCPFFPLFRLTEAGSISLAENMFVLLLSYRCAVMAYLGNCREVVLCGTYPWIYPGECCFQHPCRRH